MKVITINGNIGSGKDTISKEFINNGYYRLAFADSVKDVVSTIFCWDRDLIEGDTKEARVWRDQIDEYWSNKLGTEIIPRKMLQQFGTDIIRKYFDENIWIYNVDKKIYDCKKKTGQDKFIITDCRFENEINYIKNLNGTFIEVQRNLPEWYDDAKNYNLGFIDKPLSLENIHQSEYSWIGINNPDYVIKNDSTIYDLQQKAKSIINVLNAHF